MPARWAADFLRKLAKHHDRVFVQALCQIGMHLDGRIFVKAEAIVNGELEALGSGYDHVDISTEGLTLADGTDAIKERRLLEYHAAGKAATLETRHICVAYDKSRVFGKATSSAAAFLRDGRAFWLAPKAPGASADANSARGRRSPNLNFRLALSEI